MKQMTESDWSTVSVNRFSFLAQTGQLKQVLAAMGINHTVMNAGWVTAHQRTHLCALERPPRVHTKMRFYEYGQTFETGTVYDGIQI